MSRKSGCAPSFGRHVPSRVPEPLLVLGLTVGIGLRDAMEMHGSRACTALSSTLAQAGT